MESTEIDTNGLRVDVLTRREGLLSRVGHDLRVRAGRVRVSAAPGRIEVACEGAGLEVVAARTPSGDDPSALSASDRRTIERHLRDDVLAASQHPRITFTGRVHVADQGARLSGPLTIRGATCSVVVPLEGAPGGGLSGQLALSMARFGIPPFRALMGTLRVADEVVVEIHADAHFVDRVRARVAPTGAGDQGS